MSNDLGRKARALLEATRFADDATQADADRVHAAVLARIAVGTTAAAGAAATAAGVNHGGLTSILGGAASTSAAKSAVGAVALSLKVLTGLGLATAVGVGAAFALHAGHAPPPRGGAGSAQRALVAPSPVVTEATPPAASVLPELPVPSSQAPVSGEARSPARAPAEANALDAEVALLREARQALRDGRAARALALLDEHTRRFPHGVLAEDCAAERVFALCALGSVDQARAEGLRFLASHGLSPHADAVRASCGVTPPAR
jgi:hypothetical protein